MGSHLLHLWVGGVTLGSTLKKAFQCARTAVLQHFLHAGKKTLGGYLRNGSLRNAFLLGLRRQRLRNHLAGKALKLF